MPFYRSVRQAVSGQPLLSYSAVSVAFFAMCNSSGTDFTRISWATLANAHPFTQLSFVNLLLCALIWIGLFGVRVLFGELRPVEKQELRSHFWHLVINKALIFVGMLHTDDNHSFVMWVSLLAGLCYMLTVTRFCQLRFEYGSSSPATPRFVHIKLLIILSAIMAISGRLLILSCNFSLGINESLLAGAECLLLLLASLKSATLCSLHLIDLSLDNQWRQRALMTYYCDLYLDIALLGLSFVHHLHMLYCSSQVSLFSLATLCITLHLHMSYTKLKQRLLRHRNYQRLTQNLEARFPIVSQEEVESEDATCAICWDALRTSTARRLPCAHMFHMRCLLQWLEQDATCPTCRLSLSDALLGADEDGRGSATAADGSTYVQDREYTWQGGGWLGWLPRFTFSVRTTTRGAMSFGAERNAPRHQVDATLQAAAAQLHDMFPHISLSAITLDLAQTQSAEVTAENILEGRLVQGQLQSSLHPLLQQTLSTQQGVHIPPSSDVSAESLSETSLPIDNEVISAQPSHSDYHPPQAADSRQFLFPSNEYSTFVPGEQTHSTVRLPESDATSSSHSMERSELPAEEERTFSASGEQRQRLLEERKKLMLERARQSYMSRSSAPALADTGQSTQSSAKSNRPFPNSSLATASPLSGEDGPGSHVRYRTYPEQTSHPKRTVAGHSTGDSVEQAAVAAQALSDVEQRRALMLRAAEQRLRLS